jgi:glutamine amidotransferase
MSRQTVAIIDAGGANIASLKFALARLGWSGELTNDAEIISQATRVILPGVGAAEDAMNRLRHSGLLELIPGLTQPVLGICLGMQLLFEHSEEDDTECIGVIPGRARLLKSSPDRSVPHMGWNSICRTRDDGLLDGIPDGTYFYFVHSYAVDTTDDTLATADYGRNFAAIAQRGNFMATQFHPERSGNFGAQLLKNFLES